MFTLKSLNILADCNYLKILKPQKYPIGHKLTHKNFYANNVNISAIVGQNGSGKSSLLDMIFRIINNFSYCLFRNEERDASAPLSYILGIMADLEFESNENTGIIYVRDTLLAFKHNDIRCKFMINDKAKLQQFDEFKEYEDYTNADYSKRKTIAELFFYTIATNYSIQSFIAQDYSDEDIYTSNATNPGIWLNNLFHKNDGYMTPIVLNPYRDDGWINMNTESHLTKARLAALFIEEAPDKSILDEEYSFSELYLTLDRHRLKDKFTDGKGNRRFPNAGEVQGEKNNVQNNKDHEFHDENEYLTEFCKIASNSDSYANVILSKLGFQVTPGMDNLQIQIRMYLVYKIFSIAAKYPNYNTFRSYFGNINYTFDIMPLESRSHTIKKLHNLIEKVKSDTSHIGLKFRQAMKFIEKGKNLVEKDVHKRLSYTDYAKLLGIYSHGMSVKERTEWLPPGIFNYEIILKMSSPE